MKQTLALLALTGCWFAPDRPTGTTDDAGSDSDGGIEVRCVRDNDVLGPVVVVPIDADHERVARLGFFGDVPVVLTYAPDATETRCPIAVAPLAADTFSVTRLEALSTSVVDGKPSLFALVSSNDQMAVHELRGDDQGRFADIGHVEAPAVPTTITVAGPAESMSQRPAFVAYVEAAEEVWFGGGSTLVVAPHGGGLHGNASVAAANVSDQWYAAVARNTTAGLSTALVGANQNWAVDYTGEIGSEMVTGFAASGGTHGDCAGGICAARIAKVIAGRTAAASRIVASTRAAAAPVTLDLSFVDAFSATTDTTQVPIPDGPAGTMARDFDILDFDHDQNPATIAYEIMATLWRATDIPANNTVKLTKIDSTGGTPIVGSPDLGAPEAIFLALVRTPTGPRLLTFTANPTLNPERCYDWDNTVVGFLPCL